MNTLESIWIWQEPELSQQLRWYRQVADNRRPAKFRLARHIPVEINLDTASESQLWEIFAGRTASFLALWEDIQTGGEISLDDAGHPDLLDLCRELSQRMLRHCNFCRWDCGVDRSSAEKFGTCKLTDETRVSNFFHHRGEELVFRGHQGSGTIFFTSCNMRCAFCQNGDISTDKDNGQRVSASSLAEIAWRLRNGGAHNINWVGGEVTVHLHTIVGAINELAAMDPASDVRHGIRTGRLDPWLQTRPLNRSAGYYRGAFNAPMLWNSNFYMSSESMQILRLLMDIWLPDLKFGPGRCAIDLARTPWYWETVTRNIKTIYAWGEDLAIRHLVMPDHIECCTKPILKWLAETMPEVPLNIMDQYHPDNFCDPHSGKFNPKYQPLARRPSRDEILSAYRYADELRLNFKLMSFENNARGLQI